MANRIIWIVDAAYLLKAAPGHFDYRFLKNTLEKKEMKSPIAESYYLNSTLNPPTDQQDKFHTWLKLAPPDGPKMRVKLFKLKDVSLQCPHCGMKFSKAVQKGVDVGVATLTVKLAAQGQYDTLLLSAGDGDFEDAIRFIKEELHKTFWIAGFRDSISADLQTYADKVIWLDEPDIWDAIKK